MAKKLTAKQRLFVKEYLIDKNGTRAAKAAGYSKKTAEKIASENLRKPEVASAIEAGLAAHALKADISAERVLNEIAELAFQKLNKKEAKLMSGNKLRALENLGKHLKLFTDVVESKNETQVTVVNKEEVKKIMDELENDV